MISISFSQVVAAQEFSGGAKLVGTTPFIFAEAKLWVLALEISMEHNLSKTETEYYQEKPYTLSLDGKIYPIEIAGFSPYLGMEIWFSTHYKQSRTSGE